MTDHDNETSEPRQMACIEVIKNCSFIAGHCHLLNFGCDAPLT